MARLTVKVNNQTQEFELSRKSVTLGRDSSNPIHVPDNNCSRVHSRIDVLNDGGYRIVDMNSRNGTRVNDLHCAAQNLYDGDKIRIGAAVILFEDDDTERPSGQRPFLVLEEENQPDRIFELDDQALTVGRHSSNRLQLNNESVSNRHGEFFFDEEELHFRDLGSTNGTLLDDDLVDDSLVPEGAHLEIGEINFTFHWVEDPATIFEQEEDLKDSALLRIPSDQTVSPSEENQPKGRIPFKAKVGAGIAAAVLLIGAGLYIFLSGPEEDEVMTITIPNSKFEEGDDEPAEWGFSKSEHFEARLDEGKEGYGKALLISQTREAPAGLETAVYSEKDFSTLPEAFEVTARVRRQYPGGFAGLRFQWRSQEDPNLLNHEYVSGGKETGWHRMMVKVARPPWADTLRLGCVAVGTRSMTWFDEISLEPAEPPNNVIDLGDEGRLIFDNAGRMTIMRDDKPVFWSAQLSTGGKDAATCGQHLLEVDEQGTVEGGGYKLNGYWAEFSSSQKLMMALAISNSGPALRYAASITGQGLEKMDWIEFRFTSPADIKQLVGAISVDNEGVFEEVELPIAPRNVKTLVLGEKESRVVFSFENPVQLRASKYGRNWMFAMRRQVAPGKTPFEFNIRLRSDLSGEDYQQLLLTIREAASSGRYPEVLKFYNEVKAGRAFDPEAQALADREIARLHKMREDVEKDALASLKQAEDANLLSEIRYAARVFEEFMAWLPEDEQEKYKEPRERLKKLNEEGEKIETGKEAKEILERGKALMKSGKDLLAKQCFEYLIEVFPDTKYAEEASVLKVK